MLLLGRRYVSTGGLLFCPWCFFFIAFARFPPRSLDRSSWNFATWSESGGLDKLSPKIRDWTPFPPKKMGGQKHAKFRAILYHFRLWSQISSERRKISKIGKTRDLERFLPRSTKRSGEVWSTIYREIHVSLDPLKCNFGEDYISPLEGASNSNFYTN